MPFKGCKPKPPVPCRNVLKGMGDPAPADRHRSRPGLHGLERRGRRHALRPLLERLRETRPAHAVVLSATPSVAIRWLLPRLPALERTHPKIELSVQVEQRLDALDDGRTDLAIRMGAGPWPGLHAEPLMDDALYPVMSPGLWRASGRPSKPAQLAGLRLLHDRDPQAAWASWRQRHGPARLAQGGARYTSTDLVLRAAMQGQDVALARHRLAADDVANGALVRPFGALSVPLGTAYWIMRPPAKPRAAVAAVIDGLHWQAAAGPMDETAAPHR